MKTSVVVCTYNGEKFILDQLKSIHNQTMSPDEVIIQDDCSDDDTRNIIEEFIKKNQLEQTWVLSVNNTNLGWKKNFVNAILKASGDLIYLSDQDDIWYPNKIEIFNSICEDNPNIEILFSELEAFDDNTMQPVNIFQPKYGDSYVTQVKMNKYFAECGRQGCTYAIKRTLVKYIDLLWQDSWPHDGFLWCLSIARGSLYSYNKPLVQYRRHAMTNTPSNEKSIVVRSELLKRYADMGDMLIDNAKNLGITYEVEEVIKKASFVYRIRSESIKNRRLLQIIMLLRYINYYPRLRAWIGDLVAVFK